MNEKLVEENKAHLEKYEVLHKKYLSLQTLLNDYNKSNALDKESLEESKEKIVELEDLLKFKERQIDKLIEQTKKQNEEIELLKQNDVKISQQSLILNQSNPELSQSLSNISFSSNPSTSFQPVDKVSF